MGHEQITAVSKRAQSRWRPFEEPWGTYLRIAALRDGEAGVLSNDSFPSLIEGYLGVLDPQHFLVKSSQ